VELKIVQSPDEETTLIIGPPLIYSEENVPQLTHIVNLFLEIFGECHIFNDRLEGFISVPMHRLNWDVLPVGKRPWEKLYPEVEAVIREQPEGNQQVIMERFHRVNGYEPSFVAVGRAGFKGYVVFGFPDLNIYILESTQTNNATYVFEENWERLSQMTKAEILNNELHKDRIIHRQSWFRKLHKLMIA
jgi:hypothetical protein